MTFFRIKGKPISYRSTHKQTHARLGLGMSLGLLFTCLFSAPSFALSDLFDGDFESGTLQGWSPSVGGSAIVASLGTCFSDKDTTAISIRGRFAGMLRSGQHKEAALASLTSKTFIAGRGVVFLALSEQRKNWEKQALALNVSILDGGGQVLSTQTFATALVELYKGCPSLPADSSFSQHLINTFKFSGKQIKLRFEHHPQLAANGAFTLVDEVKIVNADETPIFQNIPLAEAGMQISDDGNKTPYLSAAFPNGNIEQTQHWQYSWLINGENSRRPYHNPCIDDLEPGDYTANLYVRQNERLVTDTFHFSVPYIIFSSTEIDSTSADDDTATASSTPINTANGTLDCNERHPTDNDSVDSSKISGSMALNTPFTASQSSLLISTLSIRSDNKLKLASLTLGGRQAGDELIEPDSGTDLKDLTVSCSDSVGTLSGEATASEYNSVLKAIKISLSATAGTRTMTLKLSDTDDNQSSDISATLTVSP